MARSDERLPDLALLRQLELNQLELHAQNEQLQASHRLMKESRNRYQDLYEHAAVPYLTLDSTGAIVESNLATGSLLQFDPQKIKGQLLSRWLHPADRPILDEHLAQCLHVTGDDSATRTAELRLGPLRNGATVLVQLHTRVTLESKTGLKRYQTALINLTDRRRAEALEAANRYKGAFLANMNHEIRTPLGAMLGFIEVLKKPNLSPAKRDKCLEVLKRNGLILSRLLHDLLDLSKIEEQQLEIEPTEFSLDQVLTDLIDSFSLQASEKGLSLRLSQNGVPKRMISDPIRLRQILLNIVGNAIKFTEAGGVEVVVTAKPLDAGTQVLSIAVNDTGKGISQSDRAKLFRHFSQADGSTTRLYGGTGLGLALSRKIAQAMGGDVTLVESQLRKGSTFVITLRVGVTEPANVSVNVPTDGSADGSTNTDRFPHVMKAQFADREAQTLRELNGVFVLVVEDSPDNQLLIQHLLSEWGVKVDFANNGLEGVAAALSRDYDLILMDVQMPLLDGHAATRELRSRGYEKPIVALSAHALREDREQSLTAGCNGHITKPIDPQVLAETIKKYTYHSLH